MRNITDDVKCLRLDTGEVLIGFFKNLWWKRKYELVVLENIWKLMVLDLLQSQFREQLVEPPLTYPSGTGPST
mgnify:CR=1 FL=1